MSGSKPRKILTAIGIAVAALVVIMIMGRCSAPSQTIIQQGADSPAEEVVNAASAAAAALKTWGDSPPEILRVFRPLADLAAPAYIVTARMGEENVEVVVLKTGDDWDVPYPPTPAEAPPLRGWEPLPAPPVEAETDLLWQTAVGFVQAWLTGDDTERWTQIGYDPPELSVRYGISISGTSQPLIVPGTATYVVPVEYSASVTGVGGTERLYRVYVGVTQDTAGRWVVNGLGYAPPTQPPPEEDQ